MKEEKGKNEKHDTPSNDIEDSLLPKKWPWSLTTICVLLSLVCLAGFGNSLLMKSLYHDSSLFILAICYIFAFAISISMINVSLNNKSSKRITSKQKDNILKTFVISAVPITLLSLIFGREGNKDSLFIFLLPFLILLYLFLYDIKKLRIDFDAKYPNNDNSKQLRIFLYVALGLFILSGIWVLYVSY